MQIYFSGINSTGDYRIVEQAGVSHLLVDQFDLKYVENWTGHLALDCGAYKSYKKGFKVDIKSYEQLIDSRSFDFAVAVDIIGDPELTRKIWIEMSNQGKRVWTTQLIPVWQYGSDLSLLKMYLDEFYLVGIGGLVPLMRSKNQVMLEDLSGL
jgi:hypothetical protein